MARKSMVPVSAVTAERAARLYRLLCLLGSKPQPLGTLTRRMKCGVRGFYRDLEVLRASGIVVTLENRHYVLHDRLADAVQRLPFPDPKLTLGEASNLARGNSPAHRKLKEQIAHVVG